MRLYLVRHGSAVSEMENSARPLSELGVGEAKRMAEALGRAGIRVEEIRHGGKVRAEQTAQIIAKHVSAEEPVRAEGLKPNDQVRAVRDELANRTADLMLAGHLPFLERLASLLIAGNESTAAITLFAASCAGLKRDDAGNWSLLWLLAPSILP